VVSVFSFKSYKEYLRAKLAEQSAVRGYQARMAEAAGCQPSYLSQVLTGKTELTPDHAASLALYLGLHGLDLDYFLNLIHYSRATSLVGRQLFEKKMEEIQSTYRKLSERLSRQENSTAIEIAGDADSTLKAEYFSSWTWTAVHIATSLPAFNTTALISKKLKLPAERVQHILETLTQWGLVTLRDGQWSFAKSGFHLASDSPMTEPNHLNWRSRAVNDIQLGRPESLHYTSVFTMRRSDFDRIKEILIKAIEETRGVIGPSEPEVTYSLLCDAFEV
jgi:uncharacterized protein (TIGR02147 family)